MRNKNFIFGTAGFAKETDWLIQEIGSYAGDDYTTDYFVAENGNILIGTEINGVRVISEDQFQSDFRDVPKNCFIAVGSPAVKELIYNNIRMTPNTEFPNLIHPSVNFDRRKNKVKMGFGNIICAKNVITTDIIIGNFVHMNLDSTIGHDSVIGDYTTISPGVHISGNVLIGKSVFLGTGACVLEQVQVADHVKLGAGAVLVKSTPTTGTYVGVPAKRIEK
jgi:sugar O-acyltransferase (sialic acid O-acetyltransferase NeuD family)